MEVPSVTTTEAIGMLFANEFANGLIHDLENKASRVKLMEHLHAKHDKGKRVYIFEAPENLSLHNKYFDEPDNKVTVQLHQAPEEVDAGTGEVDEYAVGSYYRIHLVGHITIENTEVVLGQKTPTKADTAEQIKATKARLAKFGENLFGN